MMKIAKIRAIVSLLLLITFVVVLFTGIGLYFAPLGRVARETSWNFVGFDKWQLEKLHTISGFIMSLLIMIHLLLNYKMLLAEIKILFRG